MVAEQPGRTVQGRQWASEEAVIRRRLSRASKSGRLDIPQTMRIAEMGRSINDLRPKTPPPTSCGLTDRQRALLTKQTKALFARGQIDVRYMGVRFVELFGLCWTPAKGADPRQIECTDAEFEQVFSWWVDLSYKTRNEMVEEAWREPGLRDYEQTEFADVRGPHTPYKPD